MAQFNPGSLSDVDLSDLAHPDHPLGHQNGSIPSLSSHGSAGSGHSHGAPSETAGPPSPRGTPINPRVNLHQEVRAIAVQSFDDLNLAALDMVYTRLIEVVGRALDTCYANFQVDNSEVDIIAQDLLGRISDIDQVVRQFTYLTSWTDSHTLRMS